MSLVIRDAVVTDTATILDFVKQLAIYEKALDQVTATAELFEKTIFGDDAIASAIICERDNSPVGFAVYFYNYSTWTGKKGLYLEDLYVSESERGSGIGKIIFKHLAKIAVENNCARFEWSVLDWNEPAIRFYKSVGASEKSEWRIYQIAGDNLIDFAES